MSERTLAPSVEHRLAAVLEINRRRHERGEPFRREAPVVTISREFGCEAFPVAERLKNLLENKTSSPWVLIDKALLEELAKTHAVEPSVFDRVGNRDPFWDDVLSVLSSHWKSDKDYYRILSGQIALLAEKGNAIFVGRGGSVLLQERENTFHFRMFAPLESKVQSISRRLNLDPSEAEALVRKRQAQRDAFIKSFLNRDIRDPLLYHLLLNNGRNTVERTAEIMAGYIA